MARIYSQRTCESCGAAFNQHDQVYLLTKVELTENYHAAISMDPRGVFKLVFLPRVPKRLYHVDCFRRLAGPTSPLQELSD